MDMQKILTYLVILIAAAIALIFTMDAAVGIFGRFILMDVLFILGAVCLLWQGIETALELR